MSRTFDFFSVLPARDQDLGWIHARLDSQWGGRIMAVHGEAIDMTGLPALVAGARGYLIYRVRMLSAEIVAIEALEAGQGVGTALLLALANVCESIGVQDIWATTTNDNLNALRFYQRRGFSMEAVRRDAVAQVRHFKPSIPDIGHFDIPVRDEIDLRAPLPISVR